MIDGYTEYGYRGLEEIKRLESKPKLFQIGNFTSHAGIPLPWKIECDALVDQWDALATMIMDYQKEPFREAVGIPRGGVPLGNALNKYASKNKEDPMLVCDDVYTTGTSFREFCVTKDTIYAIKWVVFARKPINVNDGIQALFTMPGE